ncbi:uncharacterized protein MELLADRAFT_38346 [Melampsora larici-populina 98AG31]|uniref:Thioesterase domain-containing protein n=1 Tax=Melampsora larici-populina (strain 98AG31 / pathotype 3-4-7) TaxID=747676 RepID=F4RXA7_MELLP|nr:uncharacterized protein MELLADRAFT_38346 [Melampsora larici-populina 98AG31]EGG03020.1 hypothetical protein MELLADRAFT_38346 [Melampsora larici-populina 98AG31]
MPNDQSSLTTAAPASIAKNPDDVWKRAETYRYWIPIQTRWSDNDQYGHMNNAYYYHLFDTTVNKFLIDKCADDRGVSPMAFVVSSSCTYLAPVGFPTTLLVGLATQHVGKSSVHWRLALWPARSAARQPGSTEANGNVTLALERNEEAGCAAFGSFVHVFVDSESRSRVEMSPTVRKATTGLLSDPHIASS